MAEFPYVLVPNRIATLFDQIRKVNRPAKVTNEWLKQIGLTSSNDRAFVALLKSLGYVDTTGVPIDKLWAELRGDEESRRRSIGRQIQSAYKEVFDGFPAEHIGGALTKTELKNFIRPKVAAGDATVENIVATFFALRALAAIAGPSITAPPDAVAAAPVSAVSASAPAARMAVASGVSVTINLSLELPATTDGDVYDRLFESMGKHLGGLLSRDER